MFWRKHRKERNFFCSNRKRNYKNETVETISDKIKSIDTAIFIDSSLPNLVDDLTKGIHKIKFKDCDCLLEYESVKDNFIIKNVYFAIKIIQTSLMKN